MLLKKRLMICENRLRSLMTKQLLSQILLLAILIQACKEPFDPHLKFDDTGFLVVEGFINTSGGATTIQLSRTIKPDAAQLAVVETGAIVEIQDMNDESYLLQEIYDGLYSAEIPALNQSGSYRLRITTRQDKVYLSEYTEPTPTPSIDSVNWTWARDGVRIYAATHDANNNTFYFQWETYEVWEIRSFYKSFFGYQNGIVSRRPNDETEKMFQCWKYGREKDLITANTKGLISDEIHQPLIFIPITSDRLSFKYSVLVRQHALSEEAYDYLQIMKKNTNGLGSFYDPQPSELNGNITCVSAPGEPVVGYVEACEVSEQRIYITRAELATWYFSLSCAEVEIYNEPDSIQKYLEDLGMLITRGGKFDTLLDRQVSWRGTIPICADCRTRQGSNNKPSFWD
jgi:hypothetical protein